MSVNSWNICWTWDTLSWKQFYCLLCKETSIGTWVRKKNWSERYKIAKRKLLPIKNVLHSSVQDKEYADGTIRWEQGEIYRSKYLIFCVKWSKLLQEVINRKLKRWERTVTWLFLISMHGSGDKCLHYPLFWSGFLFDCPGKLLLKHWQLMEVQRTSNLIFCLRNKNQKPF